MRIPKRFDGQMENVFQYFEIDVEPTDVMNATKRIENVVDAFAGEYMLYELIATIIIEARGNDFEVNLKTVLHYVEQAQMERDV